MAFYLGQRDSGYDADWQLREVDFSWIREWGEYVSYLGKPQVWFMLPFESDDWFGDEGWYVDDVLLKKQVAGQATTSHQPNALTDWARSTDVGRRKR